jgi:hypothetical protein
MRVMSKIRFEFQQERKFETRAYLDADTRIFYSKICNKTNMSVPQLISAILASLAKTSNSVEIENGSVVIDFQAPQKNKP